MLTELLLTVYDIYFDLRYFTIISVAELHHFYAAPAPGKNFDAAPAPAAPAPAPAPTLLYSEAKFLK
jgi:hypothetical protein